MGAAPTQLLTAESAENAEKEAARLNSITKGIIGAAMRVHRALGPGLLESAYEACLAFELADMGFEVLRQQPMPVVYRGVQLECGYRTDLIVDKDVIVEVKAVSRIEPIHQAQVISYLKLSERRAGLLINFNTKVLKSGIRRLVNDFPTVSAPSARSAVDPTPLHPRVDRWAVI